jgi:hypothetical protein
MDSYFSTEKRVLVALPEISFAQIVDLDLTVQYDGQHYNVLLRGIVDGGVPGIVSGAVREPMQAWVLVTAYCTAKKLCSDLSLPQGAVTVILGELETELGDKLGIWLKDTQGRILAPEPVLTPIPEPVATAEKYPAALVEVNGDVLVQVDRDVSGIFGQPDGSYIIEYTLFNEPSVFRCILALHKGENIKVLDFQKKNIVEIIQYLRSDNLAFQIAGHFGNQDTPRVDLVSRVLKLGCAFYTRPPGQLAGLPQPIEVPVPRLPAAPTPEQETIPLAPVSKEEVVVYNGGYFPLRG